MNTCGACAAAKARQKAVPKTTQLKATQPGERIFMDLSGPYHKSQGNNTYWMLVVDDFTRKKWSYFLKKKSDLKKTLLDHITMMGMEGKKVKFVRCDNAGENTKACEDLAKQLHFQPELTAPYTPQQNGVAERNFVTLRNRAHASMRDVKLNEE